MEIFEISGNVVRPTASILTVSPFKEIWERDKSKLCAFFCNCN